MQQKAISYCSNGEKLLFVVCRISNTKIVRVCTKNYNFVLLLQTHINVGTVVSTNVYTNNSFTARANDNNFPPLYNKLFVQTILRARARTSGNQLFVIIFPESFRNKLFTRTCAHFYIAAAGVLQRLYRAEKPRCVSYIIILHSTMSPRASNRFAGVARAQQTICVIIIFNQRNVYDAESIKGIYTYLEIKIIFY